MVDINKKIKFKAIFFLFVLITIGCKTPNLVIDQELLSSTTALPVKGKQGFQIGQKIEFGKYKTNKVKRGWTTKYNIPFIVKFEGAKEKLNFKQYDGEGGCNEVFCVSKFTDHYVSHLGDFFNIPLEYEDHFAGSLYEEKNDVTWDFIIYTPDGGTFENTTSGWIDNGRDKIEIRGVREMEKQKYLLKLDVYEYEFFYKGKSIGAVQTVNNGRVWIDESQPDDIKRAIASVATGVLLRHDPKES